jgi:hypothetical protein
MSECNLCHGRKFLRDDNGVLEPCSCISRGQVLQYVSPLRSFITLDAANVKPFELMNKSQAIVKTDQSMVGLIKIVAKNWFPNKFKITTLEEINAMGFGRHHEFNTIYEYMSNSKYYILDCGFLNKIRTRNDGFRENDSLYAIEHVKHVFAAGGIIIIVLPTAFKSFVDNYRELCECLEGFGIEYFRNGKYQHFELLKKEINDEQSIIG